MHRNVVVIYNKYVWLETCITCNLSLLCLVDYNKLSSVLKFKKKLNLKWKKILEKNN